MAKINKNSKEYRNKGFESALSPYVPKDPPRENSPEVQSFMYKYMSKDPNNEGAYIFDFAAAMNDRIPAKTIEANEWAYAKIHEDEGAPGITMMMMDKDTYFDIRYNDLGGGNIRKKRQRTLPNGNAAYDANGEPIMEDNPDYLEFVNQIESEYNNIRAQFHDYLERRTINSWEDWKDYYEGDPWGVSKLNPNLKGNQEAYNLRYKGFSRFDEAMTDEEYAAALGVIFNDKTGQYEKFDNKYAKDLGKSGLLGLYGVLSAEIDMTVGILDWVGSKALNILTFDKYGTPGSYKDSEFYKKKKSLDNTVFNSLEPESLYLNYNEQAIPEFHRAPMSTVERPSSLVSIFGPQRMQKSAGRAFINGVYNTVPSVLNIPSTAAQWGLDVVAIAQGEDPNEIDDITYQMNIATQNFYQTSKVKTSQYAQKNPWSTEAMGGHIGGLSTQLGAMMLLGPFGVPILAGMGVEDYNIQARDAGASRYHTAWALPVYFGALTVTERMGPNVLWGGRGVRASQNAFKSKVVGDMGRAMGANVIPKSSSRYMNAVGRVKKFWHGEYNTGGAAVISGLAEEGIQEGTQGVIENTLQIINDYSTVSLYNPSSSDGLIYQDGMFNEYESSSFGGMMKEKAFSDIGLEMVLGAIGGGGMSMIHSISHSVKKRRNPEKYNYSNWVNYISSGNADLLRSTVRQFASNSMFGIEGTDINGNPLTIGGNQIDVNEHVAAMLLQEIDMVENIYKNYVAPNGANFLYDVEVSNESLFHLVEKQKAEQQLQEYLAKPEEELTEEDKRTMATLEQEIAKRDSDAKEWLMPEDGSKYSKGYNYLMRQRIASYGVAKMLADEQYMHIKKQKNISQKDRGTTLYNAIYAEALDISKVNSHKGSIDLTVNSKERIEKFRSVLKEEMAGNVEKSMANINKISSTMDDALNSINDGISKSELSKIATSISGLFDTLNSEFIDLDSINSDSENSKSFEEAYQKVYNQAKEISDRLSNLKIEDSEKSLSEALKGNLEGLSEGEMESAYESGRFKSDYVVDEDAVISIASKLMSETKNFPTLENISPELSKKEQSRKELTNELNKTKAETKTLEDILESDKATDKDKEDAKAKLLKHKEKIRQLENALEVDNDISDLELHYFSDEMELLGKVKEAVEKNYVGVNRINENGDNVEITAEEATRLLADAIDSISKKYKIGRYDTVLNDYHNVDKDGKTSYDHPISKSEYDKIFGDGNIADRLLQQALDLRADAFMSQGLSEDMIHSALHNRAKVAIIRGLFNDDVILAAIERTGDSEAKSIISLIKELSEYQKDDDGHNYNRFDLTHKDLERDIYLKPDGEKAGLMTDAGLELNEELTEKIANIENFINKHSDKIFSNENIKHILKELTTDLYFRLSPDSNTEEKAQINAKAILESNNLSMLMVSMGYVNSRMLREDEGLSSFDLLRGMVTPNPSGQVDIVIDNGTVFSPVRSNGKDLKLKSEYVQSFAYRYALKYMATLSSSNFNDTAKEYVENLEDENKVSYSYEQFTNMREIKAAFNGANKFMANMLKIEADVLAEGLTNIVKLAKEDFNTYKGRIEVLKKQNDLFMPNAFTITGDFSSGKTFLGIPIAIKTVFKKELEAGDKVTISLVTNTSRLKQEILDLIKEEFGEQVIVNTVHTSQALNSSDSIKDDFVIWDECSLIHHNSVNKSNNKKGNLDSLIGKKVLFLGDYSQMPAKGGMNFPYVFKYTNTSFPMVRRFSSGYRIIHQLADYYRRGLFLSDVTVPTVKAVESFIGNKLVGLRYKGNDEAVIEDFLNDTSEGTSVLIIPSIEVFKKGAKGKYKSLVDKDGKLLPEYIDGKNGKYVHVVEDDISVANEYGEPESVQGLRADKVYIAIDKSLHSDENQGKQYYYRMMYTSAGRARNFICTVNNESNNTTTDTSGLVLNDPLSGLSDTVMAITLDRVLNKVSDKSEAKKGDSTNSKDTYFRSKEHALMLDGYILTHIDTKDSKTYYRKTTGNHNSVKIVKDGVVIETRKDYFISIPGSKDVVMTLKSKGNAIDLENATAQIYNSESKKYISIPVNKDFVNAINSSSDITSLLGNDAATYIQGLKGDNDLPFGESPIVLGKPTISKGSGNTATTFIDELVEAVKNAKGYGLKIKHDNNGTSEVEEIVWDNNRKTWYFIRDSKRQELPDPRAYVSQYYVDNHISPVVQIENATNEAGEKVVDSDDLISHSEYSHKNNTIALGDIYTLNNTDYVVSAIIEGNDDVDVHLEQVGSTGSAIVKPHELISSYTAKKHDVINDEEQSEQGEEQFISDRRRRLSASYKNPLFNYLSRIFTNKNNPLGKYDDAQKQAIIRTIYRVKNNILREPRHLSGNLVFHGDYKYIDDSKGVYSPQTYSNGAFVFVLNMKNDDIVSQIRKVLGSRNKLSKDQDAINFMVESIKNFSIIETLKVPVDENRIITTSIYAGNKKRKLNDIIKEINKSNTDDVTKNTYKNFVNGVYDKLPDNKTVKQGGKPVEIDLGEYNSGNALVNENFYCPKAPDTDAEKFIENIEKRGFTVNGTTVVKDKNNQSKQSLVVRDSSGRELALYMIPKTLGQIDQKHKELYDGIIDEIKEFISKGVRAHYSDFLRDYNSLTLVNILMGNKSLILGNGNNDVGLTEIKKHFTFKNSKGLEQNFANLILSKESGKSIQKKQVEALQSFLDNLENKGTSKKDALRNEVMKLRFATKNSKLLNNKDFKQVPLSYYNMNIDNIDSRGFYIPFNDSGVNTKDNFEQDEQDDVFDLNNDHKGNSHFKGGEKIYKEAFDEYYSRVIGKNWKEVVFFTGGNPLIVDGKRFFGLYKNRIMQIEDVDGVEVTTPGHEIVHFLFDNVLSERVKTNLLTEAKLEISKKEGIAVETITNDFAEEWIAKEYGRYSANELRNNKPSKHKWYTPKGLIERFVNFVNWITGTLKDNNLNNFYEKIQQGGYQNKFVPSVKNHNLDNNDFRGNAYDDSYQEENEGDNLVYFIRERQRRKQIDIMRKLGDDWSLYLRMEKNIIYKVFEGTVFTGGTKSLKESLEDFKALSAKERKRLSNRTVSNTDNRKFSNRKLTLPYMKQHADSKTVNSYMNYMLFQHSDKFLSDIFTDTGNIWNNWKQESEQRDVNILISGTVDAWLSQIRLQDGTYVEKNDVKNILRDAAVMMQKKKITQHNTSDFQLLSESLEELSEPMLFNEDFSAKVSAIKNSFDILNNSQARNDISAEAKRDAMDVMIKLMSFANTANFQSISVVRFDGDKMTVNKKYLNALENVKHSMKDRVAENTITPTGVNKRIMRTFKGDDKIRATYGVDNNSFYYIAADGSKTHLIEKMTNGNYSFTDDARSNPVLLDNYLEMLGMRLTPSIRMNIMKENSPMVDKLTGVYTRSGFKKGKTNDSSVVFAESIFAMTASMNQWVEFESQLNNFRKSKYDSKSVNFDEINEAEKEAINREVANKRDELKQALESGRMLSNDNELKSYLDNYMNNFRINTENIDKVSEQYYDSEEEKIKTDEINFYKPSDFYPVFEIFGAMMVSNMPTRVAPFLYNDAGTRIPTTTFHSHLTKSMLSDENGKLALYRDVDNFIDNVLTTSKELIEVNDIKELKNYISEINRDAVNVKFRIEEDKGKYSIAVDYKHPMLDQANAPFSPLSVQLLSSFKDKSTLEKIESADIAKIALHNFYNELERTSNSSRNDFRVSLLLFKLGDRSKVYDVNVKMKSNYFSIRKQKNEDNKTEVGVEFDKKAIVGVFKDYLRYYEHLSIESAKRWNRVLNRFGKNIDINTKKGIFDYKGFINTLSKKFSSDMHTAILEELQKDVDYSIDKKGNVVVGKALSFDNSIWSGDVLNKLEKLDNEAGWDYLTNNILKPHFINHTKALSQSGYRLENKFKNTISYKGSGYYTQSGDSYSYNDIVYAHFLSHILYDNMFDSLIMGDHTSFSTTLEQAKRYRVVSTGYQIPSVGNRTSSAGQLRSKMSYLVFNDNQETVTLSNGQKKKVLTTDGMSYGSLVGNLYLNRSLGGSYDSSGSGLIKPLITSTDRIKNKTVLLKFAEETVSNQSYRNFRKYRDMERVVLDSWSNKANEALKREGIDFKVDLYSEFEKSYKQNKDGYMAANAVVDYLTNDVDSYISSIVEENIVMGIANESTVKSGLSNLTYGTVKNIGKLKGQNLSALELNSEDFGIVTKLSHSMEDIRYGAASLNQAEANLSSLDVEGTSFSNSMENLKMRMMELGKQKVMNRFNSSNLGRDVGVRQQLSFLRSLAIDGIKGIKGDSNFAEFVLNPHLDLRSVHIANKVREIYLSYINREVLKPRLNGFMGNIISGDAIELYEKDGLLFTLNKIEAMEGVEFNDSMIKGDKLVVGDSEYNIKGLEYMQWNEDGEMVPGSIVMANPVMDKFKMTPDEDVSDVYTIKLGDKYVNLKAYSLEERADLIVKIAKAHFEGKIDSMAIINVLEGNEYDTDVIFRNLSNSFEQLDNYYNDEGVVKKSDKGSEVMYDMLRNDIINYFNEFEDLTTVVMDRKPHGHPGQMSIHRIVSFVNDNENNVWVDMRGAVRDDTDNDGDQNTLILKAYKRDGDLKEDLDWIELNNEYVDIFKNAYSHKSNREKIDQSSDVSDMIKMANEYGNVNTDEFGTFSSALHNYNIGKAGMDAVGIAATAVSSFGVMRSIGIVDEKFLTRNSFLLPKNIQQTIYDQTIDRNLGNQLQFILENMKSQGLGLLNIPSIAVPLISSYLINYNGDKTSTSDINKEMVEFMRNSYVQKVFNEESEKNRISEYNVYPNIARNVKSKIGSLKSEMNNVNDEMLENAQKTVDESIKKVTNIYSDLRSILSKHDMNDLWTIIRGSVIGKITFDDGQIDELKDKSDDYVRDLIVSKLEEGDLLSKDLEKRFRELVEKYRGDLPKIIDTINSKLAEMRLLQLDIKKENQLLKKAEANKILPKLYDLAVRAESMRRFSGFIAIRNGVETKKNEFDKKKRQLENSIGGDLNSLINGEYNSETKAQRLSRHLDHFRKNNNELWRSKDAADVKLLLDVETDIVEAMNIEALLGHPKMKRYLEMSKVYAAPYNYIGENEGIFLDEYSGFKEVQDDIKAKLNLGTLSDEQMFLMSQTINDVFIAKYMEKEKTTIDKLFPEGLNISTIENFYNESGKFVIGDTEHASLKNIDLSTRKGRYMFEKAFPSFIMSLRDINRSVKNMSEDSIEVYDENNREALMSWVNSMDNGFLQMYDLAGRSGKEYLAFDSSMSMSPDTKRYLSEEFLKLPQDLQKLFFYYETIRNKFHYRKGSAYDAMPIDMYRDMSKYTEDIINSIKDDLSGVNRDSFIDVFTDVYTSQQKGLKYMPKNADLVELIDTDLVEMKAGKNKVFPGNNSNTSGVPTRGYQWRENDNYKKKVTVELTVNDGSIRSNLIHNIFGYGGFPMEYVNSNSNLNARSVVVYSPVIRVLSHDDMFSFKDAIRNGNNYSTTLHYTHPVNYGEGTYYTELGDMISMSKMDGKGDESGYVWNAYLNERGEVDDIKVLKSELVVSKAVNTNRDMVDRLGDQAANAVELEFDSEASISKIKRWLNNNTKFGDVKPVLAYLTNSCNLNNTATLSILMQGNLNRNSIKHGDMAQLRVSYGEENVGKIISQSDDISVYGLPVAASKLVEKRGFLSHSQEDVEQYTEEDLRNNIRDFFDTVKENPEVPFVLAKHSSRDNIATIVKDDVVMVMKEAKAFNELMAEEYAMYLQNNGRLDNLFFTLDMSHNINKALLGNTSGYEAAINDLMSTESALDEKRFQSALNYVGEDIANQIRSRLGRVPELGLKPNGTVDKNLRTLMDVYGKDGIKVWYNLFLLGDTYQWREVKVDEDKNTYVEVGEGLQYLGDVSNVDNITQDDKSYYRGQYDKPIIDSNGNLILKAREDDLYKKAGLKSFGVSMTRDLESAKEYGIGQNEVRYNLKSDELGYDVNTWEGENELSEITDNGYYLIQVSDDISNEIVKEAGEIKAINDVIVPKGKYKIQHITESDTSFTESKLLGEGYTYPIKQGVQKLFESNPELADAVYEALGFGNINEEYVYHRTTKRNANLIRENKTLKLKKEGSKRIESGNGIYSFTNLNDANKPYPKKTYGNYLIRIGYNKNDITWERGTKVEFMKLAKEGKNGNRRYDVPYLGEVSVFYEIDKILSISISHDNGKTWEVIKSKPVNNFEITPQQKQQVQQLYSQYIEQTGKQDIEGFKEFALEQMVKNPIGVQKSVDFSTMDLTKKYFTPHSINKFGVNSNMGYHYDSNASNRALMESVKKFRGRAAVTKMIQKMSTFASGMNVIAETGDSAIQQGYGKTKGWIDSKGIHINTELVTPDTYVHELTHIWLHWLRMTDTDAYNRVLEMAQVHMNDHKGLVELLSSEYNPNTREFLDEYISTVAGLYSYESVVNMLSEEGIFDSYDEASKHFKEMRDLSREIYGEISPIFEGVAPSVRELDLSVSTFTDVLESLVSDFKANRSVFSEQEGKSIMDDIITSIYGGKSPYRSYDFDTLPPINTVKDIASYLARKNLDDTSQGVFIKNNRDRALYLANMANTRLDKYGNKEKYIIIGEKTYTFDSSSSIAEDADYIEKEIISKIDNYRMEVQAGFENMLASYDPFNDSDTSLENYAKKYKLNYYSLAKMIENTGIYHGNGTIMKYSDLKNNEKYSYLFNEAFVGFDPYVVIKEIDDKPVLSFMEMSPERLRSMSKDLDGNNLLGSLGINDYNYSLSGGTLKNNSGGIKLAVMGLSALYAASKGAKIETVSIFSTPNSNMDSMVIYDINELFTDLQILSRQEQFVNNIANKEIKALFNQQDIFDKDHGSSWLNRLRQYIETKEAAYYKKSQLGNLFFGTEVTNAEFKDAIRARMRVLENKNGNAKRAYYDKEYQLLSAAYAEMDGIQKGFMKSIKDVKWWQRSIIPTHYQPEFVQQYMKEAYDKSKFVIYDEVREFQQRNKKLRKAVYRRGRAQHVGSASKALLFDASSDIFSHLFQKRDVFVMENGKRVKRQETIPWLLHYDKNDDNTKKALANRTITEEDLEYTQMVIKEMKDRAIRNIMHQKHMANNDISYDEAEKIYNDIIGIKGDGLFMNNIRNGAFVPIIQKNTTESLISALTSGMKKEDLQQWWKRANEEVFNSEELFIDALSVHSKDNTLSDRFHRQLISFGDTLSESGIEIGDKGEIVIVDYNKFKGISTNIEMGSNYFMLSSARKEYYEKYFIPAYNSYFAILELYKEEHNIDSELEGLKRWAKEWKALNIDRKPLHTRDTNPASMALIKLESIVTRAFSNAVLGLSVPIGVRSHVYNNLKGTIEVVARSIAEKRLQDNKLNMFDGVTWAKATRDMYSNKDYKKTWALARKLQVIDGTERDLIENPVNVMSKRYALQEQSLHFMNWGTDNFARTTALRAQMYFEGSWDAYSYNEKTGELEYDWRKDKRWVTKEGKVKDEGTAIRRMIYDNNNELGLDQNEFDKMSLGHDPKLASQMKYYADTYIIGTFSSDAKSLFSSRAGGKSISEFRNFAGSRMFQAGFGGSIKTVLGGGYKAIQGEDGNWIAEPEVRDYEGTAQSFMGFAKALLNMRNQSMTEWWNNSHGARRTNLVKIGVKAGTLAVLIMIMAMIKPEDDEWGEYYKRMRRRYKWLMTDMIDFYTMIEIYESPIPYVRAFNDMYEIAFNDADWTRVFKYVPVGNTMSKYGVFDKEEDEEE